MSYLVIIALIALAPLAWILSGWGIGQIYGALWYTPITRHAISDGRLSFLVKVQEGVHVHMHLFPLTKMRRSVPAWIYWYGSAETALARTFRWFLFWMSWPLWVLNIQEAITLQGLVMEWERIGSPYCPATGIPLLPLYPGMQSESPEENFFALVGVQWGDPLFDIVRVEDQAAQGILTISLDEDDDWDSWTCPVSGLKGCKECDRVDCESPLGLPLEEIIKEYEAQHGPLRVWKVAIIRPDGTIIQESPEEFYREMDPLGVPPSALGIARVTLSKDGEPDEWNCSVSGLDDCDECEEDCEGPWHLPIEEKLRGHDLKPGMVTSIADDGTVSQQSIEEFCRDLPIDESDIKRMVALEEE